MQTVSASLRHPSQADRAACRNLIRHGSKSFACASLLLPRSVREPALALYAFCRLADDAVDIGNSVEPIQALRARLARIYADGPLELAADRAFADVVARYRIPRALPEALLEGFAWDAVNTRYESLGDLRAYAARVAGSVGAMMACVMGVREPGLLARACDLGVAMQLTNIARDVGEDARRGRLYLPLTWLREAEIDPESWLKNPQFTSPLATVIARLLDTADALYRRAAAGIAQLPVGCRRGIYAACLLYAEIGCELRRNGFDSVSVRTIVPPKRKAVLVARALWNRNPGGDAALAAPPLPETDHLVSAVDSSPVWAARIATAGTERGAAFLLSLFERLEQRDRSILASHGRAR
jgi:15-cis-phytoene synthase